VPIVESIYILSDGSKEHEDDKHLVFSTTHIITDEDLVALLSRSNSNPLLPLLPGEALNFFNWAAAAFWRRFLYGAATLGLWGYERGGLWAPGGGVLIFGGNDLPWLVLALFRWI
jgi:hypothetical protein